MSTTRSNGSFHSHADSRPQTFRLPPELAGDVPRDVRLTSGGIAVAVVAVALAIGAVVFPIVMSIAVSRAGEQRQVREREGIAVPSALVVAVELSRGGKRQSPRRSVTYRYEANGRAYQGRLTLPERDRSRINIGDTIPIVYVESQPDTSWAKGYEPGSGPPLLVIPLVSAVLLLGALCVGWSVRREWILLSEGRAAQGRVTAFKKVHRHEHRAYSVRYEFRTLSGATQAARCEVGKTPPAVGALVPVVYHRDRPTWSAVYPLRLVRPSRTPQARAVAFPRS